MTFCLLKTNVSHLSRSLKRFRNLKTFSSTKKEFRKFLGKIEKSKKSWISIEIFRKPKNREKLDFNWNFPKNSHLEKVGKYFSSPNFFFWKIVIEEKCFLFWKFYRRSGNEIKFHKNRTGQFLTCKGHFRLARDSLRPTISRRTSVFSWGTHI